MKSRDIKNIPITWTLNNSRPIFVGDFRNVNFTVVQGGVGGTATISVRGSKDLESPTFTSASTIDNSWATVLVSDEQTPGTYTTSVSTVSGDTKSFEINTNLLTWIAFNRSFESSAPQVFVTVSTNQ